MRKIDDEIRDDEVDAMLEEELRWLKKHCWRNLVFRK